MGREMRFVWDEENNFEVKSATTEITTDDILEAVEEINLDEEDG